MRIELVGLAYDQGRVDAVWSQVPISRAYDLILSDDFRRKVDPRSLLYHKGQTQLLTELEFFWRQGGESVSMVELLADRFRAGVEDFPSPTGELGLDFQLIRYFSTLAMVDDFITAETFLRSLLRRIGYLHNGTSWSLLAVRDFDTVARALQDVRIKDISEASVSAGLSPEAMSFEHLVRNYIEFLSYAHNNGLNPFFYNSESDFRRWGNLVERQNRRSEVVVDFSLHRKRIRAKEGASSQARPVPPEQESFQDRLKRRREVEALLNGLRDSDPLIRQKSAESLGRLKDPNAFQDLERGLRDEAPEVRQEVVRAISTTGDSRMADVMLRVLSEDEGFSVQLAAAFYLRAMIEPRAIPLLFDGIEKGRPHFATLLATHPSFAKHRESQPRVQRLMHSSDPILLREAAFLWGYLPSATAVKSLRQLCQSEDEWTRVYALYSLARIKDSGTSKLAQLLSKDPSTATATAGTIVAAWSRRR